MKSQFDFYEAADFTAYKGQVQDFLRSIPEKDYGDWVIVKKSARIWAAFSGSGTFLIPDHEPTYTVAEFLDL